jgi:hypothetical protein
MDEGTLRERFPEIPWDQPVDIQVLRPTSEFESEGNVLVVSPATITRWVCRYCIAMRGVKAADLLANTVAFAFELRDDALNHIEVVHHD